MLVMIVLLYTDSAGGNKQHSASRDTAKLDRETEELHRMLNLTAVHIITYIVNPPTVDPWR